MLPPGKSTAQQKPSGTPPPVVLRLGASGPAVKALQNQLNELGESVLASGQYGPRTLEAVRRFQVARSIQPATGMVDAATQRALDELKAKGNPRSIPRAPRVADWFHSSAQEVVEAGEANPEDVMLLVADGRNLTLEQAIEGMNEAFERVRGGQPPDPYDDRDVLTGQVNRELAKFMRKSYLTAAERRQLGQTVKRVYELLGGPDIISIAGSAPKPAVIRQPD